MGDVGPDTSARRFEPTEELKALYRQTAKELHPDLTTDEQERARRQQAMAELNRAYDECDVERIKQILDRWRSSPEQVRGDDTAAQLVRTIREIAQAGKRLAAIKTEIEELARRGTLSPEEAGRRSHRPRTRPARRDGRATRWANRTGPDPAQRGFQKRGGDHER